MEKQIQKSKRTGVSIMVNELNNVLLRFSRDLLDEIRASAEGRLEDAALEVRVIDSKP